MKHVLFELEGCPSPTLDNEEHIKFCLFHASEASYSKVLKIETQKFVPQGVTGFALLAESHISIHTWPEKGAFRHHPCTIWANESTINAWWLLAHGLALCNEYTHRYGKEHSCEKTLVEATKIMPSAEYPYKPSSFVFAGPDQFKFDKTIDIFTAYKRYIASKPWAASNYLRDPSRKPDWLS